MREQLLLQKLLIEKFEEIRFKNPQFSRRAFAKRLNLSAGAMSELFNGHRKVSKALMQKISDRLLLDPQERAELLNHTQEKKKSITENRIDPTYLRLSADQFNVIGEWYHFAILTLMRTSTFKSSRQWIANRLGLSVGMVKQAVERLKRIELIQEDKNGKLSRTEVRYRTTDDIANVSVKKAHLQYLENAKRSLETTPVEKRDFTSLMMAIDPKDLPKAKEAIRKFQDELSVLMKDGSGPEVYQLLVSLFPLTELRMENI